MARTDNLITSWLTATPAARRLGVTVGRLKQLVASGELVARTDFLGRERYDPGPIEMMRQRALAGSRQVARMPVERTRAALAHARAFTLFKDGTELREVVIDTGLSPAAVLDLRRQYAAMGRDLLVTAPVLEDLRDMLDWRGEATERGFVNAIRARLRRAFEQGRAVAADTENHSSQENTSGNIDGRATGEGRRAYEKIEPSVGGDPRGEGPDGPGSGGAGRRGVRQAE